MAAPTMVHHQACVLLLPTELLVEVLEELEFTDLRNVRLVCKGFEKLTSPGLFETFTLYPHWGSVAQLHELSRIPHLAHHAHEIIYDDRFRLMIRSALSYIDAHSDNTSNHDLFQAQIKRFDDQSISPTYTVSQIELAVRLQ